MLKVIDCEQGTPEWLENRLGIPTASRFEDMMKRCRDKKSMGKVAEKYAYELAAQRITEELPEGFTTSHTQRGNDVEPYVVELYEERTGNKCNILGFIRNEYAGYSPDRLVGDKGCIEVKTKKPELHIECIIGGEVPSEHMKQIQGGLWVSGREWCDFVCYSPKLPLFIRRVYRDEKMIEQIEHSAIEFNKYIDDIVEKVMNEY